MTGRAKHRGERLPALFGFDAGAPTEEPETVPDNPLRRYCDPARGGCGSHRGDRCTRPGRGGRQPIQGYHEARKSPQETDR